MKNYPLKPGVLCYFGLPPKILLIMKMVIIILTTCLMQVSAASFAQKLTLSKKGATLEQIFAEIRKQTGYFVVYAENKVDKGTRMDVNFNNTDLKDVLDVVSKSQDLVYTFDEKNISLKPKEKEEPTFLERLANRWAAIDVTGRVVDETGNPLAGATVKSGGKTVLTNAEGVFRFVNVKEGSLLTISYVGFKTIELKAINKDLGNIILERASESLQEVMIGKGYYEEKQRFSVSNATRITAKDIEKQPVQNVLLALQDRVPGLEISTASGMNGSGVNVRVQGTNSLLNGSDPLIIIDGVSYPSKSLITNDIGVGIVGNSNYGVETGPGAGGAGNPLNYINPNDIESVDILRDADATSIYGARAANGAIIITTKKGKAGKTEFSFNLQQGISKVGKFLDLLNTQQYLMMRKEAFVNDNVSIGNTDYDLNGLWDTTKYTNWQKELIGGTAKYSNVNISVSGGTLNTTFRLAGTYNRRTTVFPGDAANKAGNLSFSINSTSENKKFNLQFSSSFMSDLNSLPYTDLTSFAVSMAPNLPDLRNPDGSLNWAPTSSGISSFSNPLVFVDSPYESKTTNLVSSLILSYKIIEGLQIKTGFGYLNQQSDEYKGTPLSRYAPERRLVPDPNSLRIGQYSDNNIKSWKIEPQVNYQRSIGKGKLDIILGGTIEQRISNGLYQFGLSYVDDAMLRDIKSATTVAVAGSELVVYKNVGAFGRVNYNLLDKYLLNFTARRDGSSRFGPTNKFHNFGAIGAGWIFTEEKFIKSNFGFLSFGKIRGSYGTTGSDQIGDYVYLPILNVYSVPNPYQNNVGYVIGTGANEHLQWEETRKLQFGIDLGFFEDRILISGNYVKNSSSNQLLEYELPLMTGWSYVNVNFPATIQNTAGEFTLNTINIQKSQFRWATSLNLTVPKNKLVKFTNIERSPYAARLAVGKPFNLLKRPHFIGVDPATGNYLLADANDNPTSTSANIKPDAIFTEPGSELYGGLQNSIQYKKIQFDFSFQFVKALGYIDGAMYNGAPGRFNTGRGNQSVEVLDRWQKPGDYAAFQKFTQRSSDIYNSARSSDFTYSDVSFIRLRNVSISSELPGQWLKKASIKRARIYGHAQNLFTIPSHKWLLDPETKSNVTLPPLRTITVGVEITF